MAEIAVAAAISATISAASYTLNYVLSPKPGAQERGRLQGELQVQDSAYGPMIPILYGADPAFVAPAAPVAITYVGGETAEGGGEVLAPAGLQAGDLMVAFVQWTGDPAGAAPAGWTLYPSSALTQATGGGTARAWLYYRVATGADVAGVTTYTWNADDGFEDYAKGYVTLDAWRGAASLAAVGQAAGGSGGDLTVPAVTTAEADSRVVVLGAAQNGVAAVAPGFTDRSDTTYQQSADKAQAAAGPSAAATVTPVGTPAWRFGYQLALSPALEAAEEGAPGGGGNTVAGNVISLSEIRPVVTTETTGGKGGPSQTTNTVNYYCDIGIKFGEGRQLLHKLYGDGEVIMDFTVAVEAAGSFAAVEGGAGGALTGAVNAAAAVEPSYGHLTPPDPSDTSVAERRLTRYSFVPAYDANGVMEGQLKDGATFRFYQGTDTQPTDPVYEEYMQGLFPAQHASGKDVTPTLKGDCVLFIENFNISKFGRIPSIRAKLSNADIYTAETIAADLAARVGLEVSEVDASAVSAEHVRGLPVFNRDGAAEAVSTLQLACNFDLVDSDGALEAVVRGGAVAGTIDYDDLGATDGDPQENDQPARTSADINVDLSSLPGRIDLNYFEASRDGETATVGWSRLETDAKAQVPQELNIVLRKDEAERVVRRLLDTVWAEARARRDFSVPHTYYQLKPGSAWDVPTSASAAERVRVTEVNGFLPGAFEVKGVVESSRGHDQTQIVITGTAAEAAGAAAAPRTFAAPNTSVLCLIDRLLRDRERYDGKPGFYVGARGFAGGPWGGAAVKRDREGLERVIDLTEPATLGVIVSAPATLLVSSEPTFDLYGGGTLPSFSADEVAAGKGYYVAGDLIFQARTATQLSTSPNRWELSDLSNVAALCSTNGALAAGQRFALLDSAFRFVSVDEADIGVEFEYIAQGPGEAEGDCARVAFTCAAPDFQVTTPADFQMTAPATGGEILATWTPVQAGACQVTDGITYEIRLTTTGGTLLFEGNASEYRQTGLAAATYTWQFRAKTKYSAGAWVSDSVAVSGAAGLTTAEGEDQRAHTVPSVTSQKFRNAFVRQLSAGVAEITPSIFRKQEDFVHDAYAAALARNPSGVELSADTSTLNAARTSAADFLDALKLYLKTLFTTFNSNEYAGRSRTDAEFICDLYLAAVNRTVTAGDADHTFWESQLTTYAPPGALTRAQLVEEFLNGVEFSWVAAGVYGFDPSEFGGAAAAVRYAGFSFGDDTAAATPTLNQTTPPIDYLPATGEITRARIEVDAGTATVKVQLKPWGSGAWTDALTITISSGAEHEDTGLSVAVTEGDQMRFKLTAVSTAVRVSGSVEITPT